MSPRSAPRRRALAVAITAMALLAGACSDDDDAARPSTTTTAGRTSEPDGAPTSPTSTTEAACPSVRAPEPDDDALAADLDGDGVPDEVGSVERPGELAVSVALAAGGGAVIVLPTFASDSVGLVGPADVDGDGAAELWVQTGSGASAAILGLVRFADCQLAQVTFADGGPAEVPVGGSVGTAAGLSCETGVDPTADVTTYVAGNVGEETYEVTATEYALDGAVLTRLGSAISTVSTSDPGFARYVSFECDGLAL